MLGFVESEKYQDFFQETLQEVANARFFHPFGGVQGSKIQIIPFYDDQLVMFNRNLCRFLGLQEEDFPSTIITEKCCIFENNFEDTIRDDLYKGIEERVNKEMGLSKDGNKAMCAMNVVRSYHEGNHPVPSIIENLINEITR